MHIWFVVWRVSITKAYPVDIPVFPCTDATHGATLVNSRQVGDERGQKGQTFILGGDKRVRPSFLVFFHLGNAFRNDTNG